MQQYFVKNSIQPNIGCNYDKILGIKNRPSTEGEWIQLTLFML